MNPVMLWRMYLESRRTGEPIPDDVLEYVDSVADKIVHRRDDRPDSKRLAAEALGLTVGKGGTSPLGSNATPYGMTRDVRAPTGRSMRLN